MSPARLVPLLAASLVVAATGHALAARTVPVCLQVTDGTGDARTANVVPESLSSDALDIVSGDIATGKEHLVAAVRLKSLSPDTATAFGARYVFLWSSNGRQRSLEYRQFGDGSMAEAWYDADTSEGGDRDLVKVKAVRDVRTATITFTLRRTREPALQRRGAVLGELRIRTDSAVNYRAGSGGAVFSTVDLAEGVRRYPDRYPSCLKAT